MATNFEPHECIIFVQSTKIDSHKNKAIHSILLYYEKQIQNLNLEIIKLNQIKPRNQGKNRLAK